MLRTQEKDGGYWGRCFGHEPGDVFEEAVVTWKALVIHLAVISCVQFEEFSF